MEAIERHFMDRKLGRGIIRARSTANGYVAIDLEFNSPDMEQRHVKMEASTECVVALTEADDDLLYQLSRMAISQVQQRMREGALVGDHLELDCLARPWNGDLTDTPYGGATTGCAALTEASFEPPAPD